jgi:hypothetical protein
MTVTAPRCPLVTSTEVLVAGLVVCALAGTWMRDGVADNARLATAGTVFCGVFLHAVPFLVLGVVAGAALPGCEYGSVTVARRLFGDGAVGAAAAGLPENTWVRVEGAVPRGQTYSGTDSVPTLEVSSVERIDPPANTYGS